MFAIKRKLKLNKLEEALMAQHTGFSRWVYNYGLPLTALTPIGVYLRRPT
ncbi:hypothetical protein NUACC21_35560 [Scytonema sp. NUACC21]